MRYAITPNLLANGNINPASFVKLDTANDHYALQAGVGDTPLGISGSATDTYPSPSNTTNNYSAIAGEGPLVFGVGSIVELTAGTGGWTRGNFLKPDANGYGVPVTSVYDVPGALALESANAGELARVLVLPPIQTASGITTKSVSANTTLTAQDSGKTVFVTANDKVITLPPAAAGLHFTIVSLGATGGSVGTTVAVQAADKVTGDGFTPAAGKGAVNTQATAANGDWARFVGNGSDGWNIVGIAGTWARVA